MKVIIAGGRNIIALPKDYDTLDKLVGKWPITEVVSGGARGADTEGEIWAKSRGYPIRQFLPDWNKYGKSAGMRRNFQMAEYGDILWVFPGGKGTDNMIYQAERCGLPITFLR